MVNSTPNPTPVPALRPAPHRRPATVETDSPLFKGYKSVMLYAAVKKREVPDEVFEFEDFKKAVVRHSKAHEMVETLKESLDK